jgi:hypothetical protein
MPGELSTLRVPGKTVYLLGAGFSRPAGIPTLAGFVPAAVERFKRDRPSLAARLLEVKKQFQALAGSLPIDLDNLEDLFSLADSPHAERGTSSATLKEIIVRMLALSFERRAFILEHGIRDGTDDNEFCTPVQLSAVSNSPALSSRRPPRVDKRANCCLHFAFLSQVLTETEPAIVTLNYDLVIEQVAALFSGGVVPNYALHAQGASGAKAHELPILKLHGSINWRHESPGGEGLIVTPLDELSKQLVAASDFRDYALIPPTWRKGERDHSSFERIARSAIDHLQRASKIVVIGYSMPASDLYFRDILAHALVTPEFPRIEVWDVKSAEEMRPQLARMFGERNLEQGNVRYHPKGLDGFVNRSRSNA